MQLIQSQSPEQHLQARSGDASSVDSFQQRGKQEAIRHLDRLRWFAGPCVLPPDVLAEWTQDSGPSRRIGSGSLGDVFEAHCPRLGGSVGIFLNSLWPVNLHR